jgi:PAS domain S-box-containing protein
VWGADIPTTTKDVDVRFRLAVEAAPNAILMIDAARTVILVNERAEQMFGYTREELLGRPIDVLVPLRFRERHEDHVRGYFDGPSTRAMGAGRELFGRRKDGTEVPVEIGLSHLSTEDGTWALASIIDITARRQAEQRVREHAAALDRSNRELERSNRDLYEFAYVASHDLRAPLRDIDNLSQWIAEDAVAILPPASQKHLVTLQGRVRRMERLLEDLLHYSRAGRVAEPSEEVDLGALLADVVELAGTREGFVVEVPAEGPTVRTPRAPLLSVLVNLIGNAIKHHDHEGGRVVVSVADTGDRLEITVSDDGPGIPAEFHERAFGMFTTLRPRDEVEGTGMGLALVKRVVELHGGTIGLDSGTGRGAAFRFTWPRVWPVG